LKLKRQRPKTSILRDQIKRLLPYLSYVTATTDDDVRIAQFPARHIGELLAQGQPISCQTGAEFFADLVDDIYWRRLWILLQRWPADTLVLKLGHPVQTIFIVTDSLVLETTAIADSPNPHPRQI